MALAEASRGIYPSMGIDFTPMLWGADSNESSMRQYVDNNPGVKYLQCLVITVLQLHLSLLIEQ